MSRIPSTGASDARVAWYRLLQVSTRVVREFDRQLDDAHRIGAREFDVLIQLDNHPDAGMRMTNLARSVMLSSGGLTRLVDRLEARGLVQRRVDPADARAAIASLTRAGRQRLAEARVTHDAIIAELVAAPLEPPELDALTGILGKVLDAGR
jgi:DNA-binding MarR family transcriptional regulator